MKLVALYYIYYARVNSLVTQYSHTLSHVYGNAVWRLITTITVLVVAATSQHIRECY